MIFGDYDSARDMGLQWIPEDGQAFIPETNTESPGKAARC